jgi:hypothetical protein
MAHTDCPVCLVSTVSGCCKNALGRGISSSGHITKLEQSRFSIDIYGTNLFKPAAFNNENIFSYFTKEAILIWKSTILSLPTPANTSM